MTDEDLLREYNSRYESVLVPLAERLASELTRTFAGMTRVDRVSARAKSPPRFLGKAQKVGEGGTRKYSDPFDQIQDLVAARVVVFYAADVDAASERVERYYRSVEQKDLIPEPSKAFGYVGKHYILAVPEDAILDEADRDRTPQFFELQVKTLFQHAWSEAEHDVGYKPGQTLTPMHKRQLSFTAAQAWGADLIFSQLHAELGGAPHL
jgi:putative GTP pyrophosphokinase